jgi:1-deoxy-D-xylulose-5-phosphate reductoisomerase
VVVLGSTGSIGVSTLSLFEASQAPVEIHRPDRRSQRRKAHRASDTMATRLAVIEDESKFEALRAGLTGTGVRAAAGTAAVVEAAAMGADWVMSAIVGRGPGADPGRGRAGAVVALANKESLVCAGPALLRTARWRAGR